MENTYGIGIANRYALFLDDESDPLETISLKEQEKALKKKTKVAEKENKVKTEPVNKGKITTAQKKTVKEPKSQEKRDENRPTQKFNADGKPDRERNFTSNKPNNENREERNNRKNREDRQFNGPSENREREERPRREFSGDNFENRNRDRGERREGREGGREGREGGREGREGGREGREGGREGREGGREGREGREGRAIGNKPGGPRGPRRNFDDRRGKREFDRQSGSDKTGVKPIDKRDGAGPHNWGSTKDVIEEADRPNEADQSWGEEPKPETTETEKKEEVTEVEQNVEEEPKELTLDEWKAQRAGRAKPQYNIRKAGEGEDPTQWKKMFELRKKEKEEESEDEEYDAAEYPQRVGRQKHILDIDIQFNDTRRPGGGGGGGRGRGQRSGPRGNRGGSRGAGGERRESGRDVGERTERRFRGEEQGEDKHGENRQAPKVDDERDFPSLG